MLSSQNPSNTKIRFTNESLEDCLFTGTFDQQPIDSVMKVIQVAFDLDLDQNGKAYVLSGDASGLTATLYWLELCRICFP